MLRGGGIVFSLLGAGLALGLFFTPDNGKNRLVIIIEVYILFKNSHLKAHLGFLILWGGVGEGWSDVCIGVKLWFCDKCF